MRTIASVDFNGYKFVSPTVIGFVDRLPDLAIFHANSNNFSSTSPDLKNLKFFYELDFSNNNLTGPFPSNLLPLFNLTFLDLRFNHFVGAVPPAAFNLNVSILFLNNNNFSGPIPDNLGDTKAIYLTFANNHFTGPIPRSISRTSDTLLQVLFLNNKLSGCLPYEIGLLKKTTIFDAGSNCITGPIPLSFGCLRCMEELSFANNRLYGNVPDELCKIPKLTNLSLSGNYFTSLGESCWMLIKRKVLDVKHNCIPWLPDQRPKAECEKFFSKQKINCPLIKYIPCKLPLDGSDDELLSSPAGGGRSRRLLSSGNVYGALINAH
ncbi:hypothetical protein J5N97_026501 [Dioscorea zingiberensis]|uniref:Uncharacterized protein n=1 Tax=Dioscorea zingiberensis TaxID=325984 RepID=A0A9D5C324_9LILI|nr:hypothetical protein J5N97_026501 [Dioscorea zingiberensis]